jgi:hypothetical protein
MRSDQVIVALVESILRERSQLSEEAAQSYRGAVTPFVLAQCRRMPDYIRFPFKCLTLVFGAWPMLLTGRPFHHLSHEQRAQQVRAWRASSLGFRRDFIKFFDAFVIFAWYSERYSDDDRPRMSYASPNS